MWIQSQSRLLLLATLTGWAASSGLVECGEDLAAQVGDPLLLATQHAEPRPCAPSAKVADQPAGDTCCDDDGDRLLGTAILAIISVASASLSAYGLWMSLRADARRAAGAEAPPSMDPSQGIVSYRSQPLLQQGNAANMGNARSVGSGTPSVRSWEAEQFTRSRARSGGSARSWVSNPDGAELSETPQTMRNFQLWIYSPPENKPMDVRKEPSHGAQRVGVGVQLQPGKHFFVNETKEGEDGVTFLRIEDGRGWVFDRLTPQMTAAGSTALIAAGGVLCKPVDLIELRVMPEEDKAGFKIAFKPGGPLVSAVSSASVLEAGLRAGDRIVRVDGFWIMEQHAGRAALQRAVNVARANDKPMVLDIFRQEEDDLSTGDADVEEASPEAHDGNENGA